MNRTDFEGLRDLPGKMINGDIRFSQRQATQPNLVVGGIRIENGEDVDLRMMINYSPGGVVVRRTRRR